MFLLHIVTYLAISTSEGPLKSSAGVTPCIYWMFPKGSTRHITFGTNLSLQIMIHLHYCKEINFFSTKYDYFLI